MATITTDVFLDDGTARTQDETWALNGGSLTIRTDTRWHEGKPAGTTGSIGAITGSASLGGGVLIDGRNVREVTFNSGTGTVPAIGTLITQGGVTGYLLGVWPDLASVPTAPAAAMPTTGFLKFREITGGAFSAGALTGIGASADGPDVPSWIEFVQRQAVANTINRLNFFRVRGTWYTLPQTTSGSANQLIQVPTNGGGVGTEVPAIWIETGVGTNIYEAFPSCASSYFSAANLSTDERSKIVESVGNGQVRIGFDGVANTGFVPPAGCRIRIPNVLGRQTISGAGSVNVIPSTTLSTRPDYTTTSNGVIDFEYFMSDSYFLFATPNNVFLKNCATFDILNTSNNSQPCEIDNLIVAPYNTTSSIALTLANNPNGGYIRNSKFFRGQAASNGHAGSITLCSNYEFDNTHHGVIQYARSTGRAITMSQVQDTTFNDYYQYNSATLITTCARIRFTGLDHNDRFFGSTNSTTGINMILFAASSDSCEVNGFTFGQKGVVTDFCNPYLALVNNNASSNIRIRNGGTFTNKLRVASEPTAPQYIIQDGGVTNGLRAQRIFLDFSRTGDLIGQNTSKNIILENCQGSQGSANVGSSLSFLKGTRRGSQPNTGSLAVVGTHFIDFFQSDTTGVVSFLGNEPTAETAPFVTTNLTTSNGGFNAAGQFVMPAVDDFIIIESPYTILGHTGFRNNSISVSASNGSNMKYEYDLDTGSGYSGVWTETTFGSPFPQFSEVISETGFRMKVRVTTITANPSNAITVLSFLTTSTFDAQRDNLYPQDLVNINLSGLVPNSRVQLYDVTNSVELFNQVVTGTTLNFETEYAADFDLRVRAIFADDTTATLFFESVDTITVAGLNKSISQETDSVYVANGIDGFLVTDIAIVDSTMLVEIDSTTLAWPTIYAYCVAWLYSEDGIRDEGQFIEALDQANYLITGFQIKNVSSPSVPLTLTNGWGRDSVTNTTTAIVDNSGGSIFSNPDLVVPFASGSGLSPTQDATLSKLDTLTENVGGLRYTAKALEEAPGGGGGGGDWTATEKEHIRNRLGIDGTASAPSATPTLATPASVRTNLTTELARIDVAISTRNSVVPTNLSAAQVRTELSPELARIDVATSTRLASASYTTPPTVAAIRSEIDTNSTKLDVAVSTRNAIAPDNASVTAIKAKTDNLPVDPASNTQVNTRLATSGYTAPANADIAAIKAKTDTLVNTDLTGIATTVNVTSAQTAIITEVNQNEVKIDAIKAKTDILVNTDLTPIAKTTELNSISSDLTGVENKIDEVKANTDLIPALL